MTIASTPREIVDAVLGPPTEEVITAIAEDADTDALAARLEQELDRRSNAPTHRLHLVDDISSASAVVRAAKAEPRSVHVVSVRAGLGREAWRQIDRSRTRSTLAALILVLSPATYVEARTNAPNLTNLAAASTHHVRSVPRSPDLFRVVAHPMHERELDALLQSGGRLREIDESIVVGELDGAQIDQLRAQNIIVDVYGPAETGVAPLFDTLWSPIAAAPPPDIGEWPGDFEVTIDPAALIVLDREPLPGVEVLEPLGNRRYRVRLTDADAHAALLASAGVGDDARVDTSPAISELKSEEFDATWTVLLHDAATRDAVRARLEGVRAIVLKADGRALRITALPSIVERARAWPEVRRIDAYVEPTLCADVYRGQIGLEIIDATGAPRDTLPWDGTGEVIAMADSGIDAAHPALHPAIDYLLPLARPGDASDQQGHGTHVAGIIAGRASVQPPLRGAAPGARLVVQCIVDADAKLSGLPADLSTLLQSAYDLGARVHNNSWGAEVEGRYDAQAEQIDEFVSTHRDMLVVIAAGNRGRAAKTPEQTPSAEVGWVEYGSLDAPAVAKNALTVGACQSGRSTGGRSAGSWGQYWGAQFPDDPVRSQRISGDAESMAAFSSRGPVESCRIKPDLVAPGTDIASTWPEGHPGDNSWGVVPGTAQRYRYLGGTSMAAPIVAGCAARVRQYFREVRGHQPSAALLKATLMNGARPLTGADAVHGDPAPNFNQGFGCIDMRRTVPFPGSSFSLAFEDPWQDQARWFPQSRRFRATFALTTPGPLGVCLAWTDPPGPGRRNNLFLVVDFPNGTKRRGNDERAGKIPSRPDDEANTVVAVRLADAPAGTYTVTVKPTMMLRPPQDFALVVTGPLAQDHLLPE